MKLRTLYLFITCLFSTAAGFSEIKTIHHLDEIEVEEFSSKTLVMFDIDDVLIYPQDALLQNWRSGWKPVNMRSWTPEEDTIAWMNAKFQLMDPAGPSVIDTLNEKDIPAIGFTTFAMEDSQLVKSIPDWRSSHLQELGINFKWQNEVIFHVEDGFVPPSLRKAFFIVGTSIKKTKTIEERSFLFT